MDCPVCGGSERTIINVRLSQESDLTQVVGSTWDGRNMARCDECGVLYDHRHDEPDSDSAPDAEKVNCPECGARTAAHRETCSYCEAPLSSS